MGVGALCKLCLSGHSLACAGTVIFASMASFCLRGAMTYVALRKGTHACMLHKRTAHLRCTHLTFFGSSAMDATASGRQSWRACLGPGNTMCCTLKINTIAQLIKLQFVPPPPPHQTQQHRSQHVECPLSTGSTTVVHATRTLLTRAPHRTLPFLGPMQWLPLPLQD